MAVIKSLGETVDNAADKAKSYAKSTEAHVRLQIFKHIGVVMSFLVKGLILGSLLITALLFFSVSYMVLLSEWLGSLALACGIVGLLFLLGALIAYYNRKAIDRKILMNLSQKLNS
ncbi:MAG: hypothetical protein AAGH46_02920 [Bacteroidota bacterium]